MTPATKTSRTRKRGKGRKESPQHRRKRGAEILRILRKEFPGAGTALAHEDPLQLLIATILSAQCTDERVNKVTPGLFAKYPTAAHLAAALPSELEQEIRSTGFFRMKAKSIMACSKALVESHGGKVPDRMEDLVRVPGVGRKTANVVLGQAFGIRSGVVVDTHVQRLAQRLGLTEESVPEKIETDLMALYPQKDWIDLGSVLILHGRRTCNARKPKCAECSVQRLCPSAETFLKQLR